MALAYGAIVLRHRDADAVGEPLLPSHG